MAQRAHWGSKFGFVMAAAGSAVGLGNLWKFPYITWENNGGAFVIIYLVATIFLGLPIMMAEILIGRRAQLSAVPAFEKLGGKGWSVVGWLGVASGTVILSYYTVIAGWSLSSFVQCLNWSFSGYVPLAEGEFGAFLENGPQQVGLTTLFSVLTGIIVYRGVGKGIEKATTIMMPILVIILLYLAITALTLEGRDQALKMIFVPNFKALPPQGILMAVGQAFFSLSLGLGAMIVYGSYLTKKQSIFQSALWVTILDTAFALVACITMFTIIFSVPGLKDKISGSTVGMLFITLPDLFYTHMPFGKLVAPLFFVLVSFAALSSTISLGEVVSSLLIDKLKWSRPKAVTIALSSVYICSLFAALSLGCAKWLSNWQLFKNKDGLLSTLDHLAANFMLPLGGLGAVLFVGFALGKAKTLEELGLKKPTWAFQIWLWSLRVVCPVAIIALLIAVVFGGWDLS